MAFDWSAKLRNFLRSFGGEDAGPWQIWEQQLPEGCARTPEIIALPGDHGGILGMVMVGASGRCLVKTNKKNLVIYKFKPF